MGRDRAAEREDLLVLLAGVPERLADLVLGLDRSSLNHRHAPALPTLGEVADHLCLSGAAVETLVREACLGDGAELGIGAALAPPAKPAPAPLSERLESCARLRRRTVDLLRGLSEEGWRRPYRDPERGEVTLALACELIAGHELGHLAQLRGLIALLPAAPRQREGGRRLPEPG